VSGSRRSRLRLPRVHSLRTRFGLWVAALLLVALAVYGTVVYLQVHRVLLGSFDDSLRVSASLAASDVTVAEGGLVVEESMAEVNLELEVLLAQGDTIKYLDTDGSTITGFGAWESLPLDPAALAAVQGGRSAFSHTADSAGGRDYRVYTMPLVRDGSVVGFVQAMHDSEPLRRSMGTLLAVLLIGGGLVALGTGLLGYLLARRALAPIDTITKTARRISAQDLSARLGRLASTFDDMLDRLDQSFQRERRFTADASHELRTPLAAMEAILGVVRSEPRGADDYEQALDDLADEAARLRALVERLLELARSGQAAATESGPVDLSTLVDDVCEALGPLSQAKGLAVECRLEPGLFVRGDSDSLIRLFVNLVENAIKFTEQGGVTVTGLAKKDSVVVEVADTGMGIAAARLPHIFERFYRGDPSRSAPGAGLGLALAQQIALNHKGTLTAHSHEGKGSTFTVTLPTGLE
jgi:signal transduction histidine kinase